MCLDPVTAIALASTVATAAGGYINTQNQNAAIEAQNDANWKTYQANDQARRAEKERQQGIEQERTTSLLDTAQAVDPATRGVKVDEKASSALRHVLAARRARMSRVPEFETQGAAGGELANFRDGVIAEGDTPLGAAVWLGADAATSPNLTLAREGADQAFMGDRAAGSLDASRLETTAVAPRYRPSDSMLGDALLAAGQMGSFYSGKRAGKAAAAAGGP